MKNERHVGSCSVCSKRGVLRLDLAMAQHGLCPGSGKPALHVTKGGKTVDGQLEEKPMAALPMQIVLTFFIERELEEAQKQGLVAFAKPEDIQTVSNRIATNLLSDGDERSGRRKYDRLRESLWNALRWKKPSKNRRWNDGKPEK